MKGLRVLLSENELKRMLEEIKEYRIKEKKEEEILFIRVPLMKSKRIKGASYVDYARKNEVF